MQQVSSTTEVIRVIWPNSADKSHHNVLTKSEPTSKWTNNLRLVAPFQMPVLCAHQARTGVTLDQWSAFGRAHFRWPQVGFSKCQYNVLTRPETTQKWTNDLRLVAPTHAFHMPVHSSQLEFMTETSVHTQIMKIFKTDFDDFWDSEARRSKFCIFH